MPNIDRSPDSFPASSFNRFNYGGARALSDFGPVVQKGSNLYHLFVGMQHKTQHFFKIIAEKPIQCLEGSNCQKPFCVSSISLGSSLHRIVCSPSASHNCKGNWVSSGSSEQVEQAIQPPFLTTRTASLRSFS